MTSTLMAEVLVEGHASGEVLFLEEALSFWGGFDPELGEIIDVHHPQAGKKVKDRILVIPASRGSAGTPACVFHKQIFVSNTNKNKRRLIIKIH